MVISKLSYYWKYGGIQVMGSHWRVITLRWRRLWELKLPLKLIIVMWKFGMRTYWLKQNSEMKHSEWLVIVWGRWKLSSFILEMQSCLGCIVWIDLSLRTKFISPCSLKRWLPQWMEDPKFQKQEYVMFSRLVFKGAKLLLK